jgi:hypothetical protein
MKFIKKCHCGFVAIAAFILCVLVGYVNGYTLGHWGSFSWIAALFIALAAGLCLRCRQKEDNTDEDQITPARNA